jgi:hypothetical protein
MSTGLLSNYTVGKIDNILELKRSAFKSLEQRVEQIDINEDNVRKAICPFARPIVDMEWLNKYFNVDSRKGYYQEIFTFKDDFQTKYGIFQKHMDDPKPLRPYWQLQLIGNGERIGHDTKYDLIYRVLYYDFAPRILGRHDRRLLNISRADAMKYLGSLGSHIRHYKNALRSANNAFTKSIRKYEKAIQG